MSSSIAKGRRKVLWVIAPLISFSEYLRVSNKSVGTFEVMVRSYYGTL